ncbi:MAG: hypothetical protein HY836_07565 [Aquabacterium sp.]|uniref:pilus assembly protein n=1 Tax=Aquabacterium sp. TaxID=1872578 RepID=UPI0025BFB4A1|nr:PilC/PilY family type IV pilus protein [Aquabacterium sp.]MBI5925445.1 hypothetical protein [Aquabacterium sp.]
MNDQQPARRFHVIRLTTLAFMLQQLWMPAHAVPDQSPLVNRPEGKPLPNLMLTFDESGSMTQHYLPEGTFKVGKHSLSFGIQGPRYLFAHPLETKKNRFTGGGQNWTDSIFMTSVPLDSQNQLIVGKDERDLVLQYQSRSPQVNQIYYNPAIKYKPWTGITKDGLIKPFYNADPKNAHLDPLAYDPEVYDSNFKQLDANSTKYPAGWVDTTSAVDLTKELSNPDGTSGFTAKWHSVVNRDRAGDPKVVNRPYSPALVYLLTPGLNPGETGSYTYFNLNADASKVKYPDAYPDRTDCDVDTTTRTTACDKSTELQNYANWFVFYRSRLFIAQGALPDALLPLGNQFRMGWGGLHPGVKRDATGLPSDFYDPKGTNPVDGVASSTVHRGVREWTTEQKYDLTKWIRVLKTYGGTPTRQATLSVKNYFTRTDNLSPWSSDMVNGSALNAHLRCRRAYNVVLTDGYYNDPVPTSIAITANVDGNGSIDIDGLTYPFKDESTNTLADYAMDAWLTDLQGDKAKPGPDNVKAITVTPQGTTDDDKLLAQIKSDPATYRHLTQFYMGFGLTGSLLTNDVLNNSVDYNNALLRLAKCGQTGGECWKTFDPDKPSTTADIIDDIWHAALNSRGQFFNIGSPKSVKESIDAIVNRSSSDSFKEGGLATASTSLIAGNIKFVPEYTPYTWTGTIKAYALNEFGKVTSQLWNAENMDGTPTMPQPANRNIYVGRTNGAVAINDSALGKDMIAFLRGEKGSGDLRQRDIKHLLPDFINSTPLFVQSGSNLGVTDPSYTTFRTSKAARTSGLLFVGGNGGMVHAFNTATGQEVFAYIPIDAQTKLDKISSLDYGYPNNYHEYVVDGQLTESDVHVGTQWQNIVVGTMGAGGKSIFAFQLDTVDPTSSLNATTVKWDVTSPAVGYITSTPQIGQLPNGTSRIFVGNGVDSTQGIPSLLSIDPADGSITVINLPTPTNAIPPTGTAHGLGGVTLVKDNKTGYVTTIYAGDTLGRIWRFDVDANGTVSIGYDSTPLFTATDKDEAGTEQPVLAAPLVYAHPLGGQVVVFNTGKLLYDADNLSPQRQAAYGVWDKISTTKSTASEIPPAITRANLLHQSISSREVITQSSGNTATFFDLTSADMSWTGESAKLGWVLDLAVPESSGVALPKAIYDPQRFSSAVLISAVAPGSTEESCTAAGAKGYGFLIDAITGKQSKVAILDTNGDGLVTGADAAYSGFTYGGGSQRILTKDDTGGGGGGGGPPQPPCGSTPPEVVGSIQNAGGDLSIKAPGTGSNCSTYKVKDRIWRQLLNPPHP